MKRLLSIAALLLLAGRAHAQPFTFLLDGYTQELIGPTTILDPEVVGGLAFASDGDPWVTWCVGRDSELFRFDVQGTQTPEGTYPLVLGPVATQAGCGLANHPDGFMYSNTVGGVTQLDRETAAPTGFLSGAPGNALGIATDPKTLRIVYVGFSCRVDTPDPNCMILQVDPRNPTVLLAPFAVLPTTEVGYVDGIYFDPTGNYLFLATRQPANRLTILDRSGNIVQNVALRPGQMQGPDGIAFHVNPTFVATTNLDGTLSRFDFPNNDYAQPPLETVFASGGFRGDLTQVGRDGCLYLTQRGIRYASGLEATNNSVVRVCPGFVPPIGSQTCTVATEATDCGGATPACQENGTCGECSPTNQTRCAGAPCNTQTGLCGCNGNADCTQPTPVCRPNATCGQCNTSADCPSTTPNCDTSTGLCRGCNTNSDCPPSTPICDGTGRCRACQSDTNCTDPSNPACQPGGTCGQCSATNTSQCTGTTPFCDTTTGTCRGCRNDGDCTDPSNPACQPGGVCGQCSTINKTQCTGNTPICNVATGSCRGCSGDNECPPSAPLCDSNGSCRRCIDDRDCSGATPACNGTTGACTQCSASNTAQCTGATPFCNAPLGMCTGSCSTNSQCGGATPVCNTTTGLCTQCSATNTSQCTGATPACNTTTGTCVECTVNTQCGGATPVCNTTTNTCVACVTTGTGSVGCTGNPNGGACLSDGSGTPFCGCDRDADCGGSRSGRICDTQRRQCVDGCSPASGRNNCPLGQFCTSNDTTGATTGVCTTTCNFNGDCSGATPYCLVTGTGQNRCVGCRTSNDCAGRGDGRTVCDPGTNMCVQCTQTNAQACSAQGTGSACLASGVCGCTVDSHCGPPSNGRVCDNANSQCRPGCRVNVQGSCPTPQVCVASDGGPIGQCMNPRRPDFNGGGFSCTVAQHAPAASNGMAWVALAALGLLAGRRTRRARRS